MELTTLNNKITINKNGVELLDLCEPSFTYSYKDGFTIMKVITVSDEYDRRPDLISLAVYGSDEYLDILLKFNEISSPLDVRSGEILIIPELNSARKFFNTPEKESTQISQPNEISINNKDANRLKELSRISSSIANGSKQAVRSNQISGEPNIKVVNNNLNL